MGYWWACFSINNMCLRMPQQCQAVLLNNSTGHYCITGQQKEVVLLCSYVCVDAPQQLATEHTVQ